MAAGSAEDREVVATASAAVVRAWVVAAAPGVAEDWEALEEVESAAQAERVELAAPVAEGREEAVPVERVEPAAQAERVELAAQVVQAAPVAAAASTPECRSIPRRRSSRARRG